MQKTRHKQNNKKCFALHQVPGLTITLCLWLVCTWRVVGSTAVWARRTIVVSCWPSPCSCWRHCTGSVWCWAASVLASIWWRLFSTAPPSTLSPGATPHRSLQAPRASRSKQEINTVKVLTLKKTNRFNVAQPDLNFITRTRIIYLKYKKLNIL